MWANNSLGSSNCMAMFEDSALRDLRGASSGFISDSAMLKKPEIWSSSKSSWLKFDFKIYSDFFDLYLTKSCLNLSSRLRLSLLLFYLGATLLNKDPSLIVASSLGFLYVTRSILNLMSSSFISKFSGLRDPVITMDTLFLMRVCFWISRIDSLIYSKKDLSLM